MPAATPLRLRRAYTLAVFVFCLAWFGFGLESSGLASAEVDPVSRIPALDDAVYAHEAIAIKESGNWLTPFFLGRYALNKPPLLQWLAALSVRLFGVSAWALRLPSLLAASFTAALLFEAVWRHHSLVLAAIAVLLLISSHLYYVFARLAMTDMLLTLFVTAAMLALWRDSGLKKPASAVVFGACLGGAILAKAAAGLLPLVALAIYAVVNRFSRRSAPPKSADAVPLRFRPVLLALATTAVVAIPWHLYELAAHGRWFFAEYILTQHFAIGVAAPPQYSSESHLAFYARRLFLMDPVLTLAGIASLPLLFRGWRQRLVIAAWLLAVVAALFAFRYRSAYYLLPLLPVLAILAAELASFTSRAAQVALAVLLLACLGVKAATAAPVWGIPFAVASQRPVVTPLERYCEMRRGNGLVIVGDDDQFYASVLPLAGLRYCLLRKRPAGGPLDFAWLGVDVSVPEFEKLTALRPVFRQRLAAFGMASDASVGTVISAASPQEIGGLISAHPELDFAVPAGMLRSLDVTPNHQVKLAGAGTVLLLAPAATSFIPGRACRL